MTRNAYLDELLLIVCHDDVISTSESGVGKVLDGVVLDTLALKLKEKNDDVPGINQIIKVATCKILQSYPVNEPLIL